MSEYPLDIPSEPQQQPLSSTELDLATLRNHLPSEAYSALTRLLQGLDNRVINAESQASLIGDQLRHAVQDAFSSASFNVHTSAPPTSSQQRPADLRFDIPTFSGNPSEVPSLWLAHLTDVFSAKHIPRNEWGLNASNLLRNTAQTWYFRERRKNGDAPLDFAKLQTGLLAQFESPQRTDTLRDKLLNMRWTKDWNTNIRHFSSLEMQIPDSEMTFADRRYNLLRLVPSQLAFQIRKDALKFQDMQDIYDAVRAFYLSGGDRTTHPYNGNHSFNGHRRHQNTLPFPSQPITSTSSATPMDTALGPGPMDLDTFEARQPSTGPRRNKKDMSRVRCYGCNQYGHYSKTCPNKRTRSSSRLNKPSQVSTPPPRPGQQQMYLLENGQQFAPPDEFPFDDDRYLYPNSAADFQDIEMKKEDEDLTYLNPSYSCSPLEMHNMEQKSSGIPTYGATIKSKSTSLPFVAVTIIDSGAPSSYISQRMAKVAGLDLYPITKRNIVGAGNTTTTAFARFKIQFGSITETICAYVLDDTSGFRYDLLLGLEWMRLHKVNLLWDIRAFDFTCPKTKQKLRVHAYPASRIPLQSVHLENHLTEIDAENPTSSDQASIVEELSNEILPKPKNKLSLGAKLKAYASKKFKKIFRKKVGYPPNRKWNLNIDTGDAQPIRITSRPHSPPEQEIIKKFIEDGLKDKTIEPSTSPWSAPLLLVPKKDGKTRVCVDFRALNRVTRRNAYPLPRIDDSYQTLAGARFFTTLDLKSGYWQVRLHPDAVEKTAFTCRYGHYQFRVMPFGLTNAPALFQQMMNEILHSHIDICAMVYLDDVIIYSATENEHVRNVLAVLQLLEQHNLVLNLEKCTWALPSIPYLGHIVSGNGISPNPDKVRAIMEWPRPQTVTTTRGFLNLAGYYRRFIHNFAKIAAPLYDLLRGSPKKGTPINWTNECEVAFDTLKSRLTSPKFLAHPRPWHLFVIDTDASDLALGAVLQQSVEPLPANGDVGLDRFKYKEKNLRTIAFESRRMSITERNYSAQEREALAIVNALQKFRGYIEGSPILVRTDHESLKYLLTQKNPGRRLTRFIDDIAHFDLQIVYRPGRSQVVADALSRVETSVEGTYSPMFMHPVEQSLTENTELTETERLQHFHRTFTTLEGYRQDLLNGKDATTIGNGSYSIRDQFLFTDIKYREEKISVMVPTTLKQAELIVRALHHDLGHLGISIISDALKSRVWFPYLFEIVKRIIITCDACQFATREPTTLHPLFPLPRVTIVEIWAFDFVGPLPKSTMGNTYFISFMDHGSGFAYAQALSQRSADAFLTLLKFLISWFGKPTSILTDNGEEFLANRSQSFFKRMGINHLRTTPYHPQTNGRLEKFNDTCTQMLARYTSPNRQHQWDVYLPDAILAFNAHKSRGTGESPAYLLFGIQPRLPHDAVYNIVRLPPTNQELEDLQKRRLTHVHNLDRYRINANERARETLDKIAVDREEHYFERALCVGDLVKRMNPSQSKIHPRWDGPFIIRNVTSKNTYQLQTRNGYILRNLYNGARLRRYYPPRENVGLYTVSNNLRQRDEQERLTRIDSRGQEQRGD